MSRTRSIGFSLLGLSIAAFLISGYFMAQRIDAYYQAQPPNQFHFEQSVAKQTPFAGRVITVEETTINDDPAKPVPALKLSWGNETRIIRTHKPPVEGFRDLSPYDQWAAVLLFCPLERGELTADWKTGKGVRAAVVSRRTAEGFDEDSWGAVKVKEFLFDFHELNADGTITSSVMQFPARDRKTGEFFAPAKRADPNSDVQLMQERTWQWQAALFAIPKMQLSRYRFYSNASHGFGWTFPAAGLSVLGLMGGIALIKASRLGPRSLASDASVQPSA
jgi:hypothetical protein